MQYALKWLCKELTDIIGMAVVQMTYILKPTEQDACRTINKCI